MARPYEGCLPGVYKREAHYSVILDGNTWKVRLIHYSTREEEVHLLCTEPHHTLVTLVNSAKLDLNGQRGGRFYIDEHLRVLVPSISGEWCIAGSYGKALSFGSHGVPGGPCPPSGMKVGDPWPGPRVGIPYRLGDLDISRWCEKSDRTEAFLRLSECVGGPAATSLARRLSAANQGPGRIYINQCKAFFGPPRNGRGWTFLGTLRADAWFPAT